MTAAEQLGQFAPPLDAAGGWAWAPIEAAAGGLAEPVPAKTVWAALGEAELGRDAN